MKLTKTNLFQAILKSLDNAEELITDARILKDNNRFARAYTLFQLAIEEVGKASMAADLVSSEDFEDELKQKKFLKDFRDHKIKTTESFGIEYLFIMKLEDSTLKKNLLLNLNGQTNKINHYNDLKNNSLYTSLKGNDFLLPSEIITVELVNDIQYYATLRHRVAKSFFNYLITYFDEIKQASANIDEEKLHEDLKRNIAKLMNQY